MTASLFGLLLALIVLPAVAASPNDSPQDLMRGLYRVHDQGNGPLLDPAAGKARRVYFTESLAAALDHELERRDGDEIGNLDFDPFYNAQDTELGDLDFAVAKVSGNETFAIARFSNFGEPIEIVYKLVQDGRGWRIDDIDYGKGHTLRKVLQGE
jgi:hypothetical protein